MKQIFNVTQKITFWSHRGESTGRCYQKSINSLSMFCAVCSDSRMYVQFLDGNNNTSNTIHFLDCLYAILDDDAPAWRRKSILVMDHCPSHKSKNSKSVIRYLKLPIFFEAPASFQCLRSKEFSRQLNLKISELTNHST